MTEKDICNYIFELGALKKFRHSGFKFAGVINPDSIAEHAYRAAMIAYLLAKMEKHKDPEKIAFRCLIHDNAEARISDLHKIAQRYIDPRKAELRAFKEQTQNLSKEIHEDFIKYFKEYEKRTTKDGKIMRDADLLETAFQAKEYIDLGYTACQSWIDNTETLLKTKSAKKLLNTIKKTKFTDWFKNLKKLSQE